VILTMMGHEKVQRASYFFLH